MRQGISLSSNACPTRVAICRARAVQGRSRRSLQVVNGVKDVFMPALSSTMTEGKIVSWLKSPGDKVKKGESIVVVESGAPARYSR
jgi:biotin carboxyl carrier protein